MKNNIITLLFLLTCLTSLAQKEINWVDLSKVEFEKKYIPKYGRYFLYPHFSDSVKALEGKKVTITGYLLDLDPRGKIFVLSQGPMASCFFCGVGGPETAVELYFTSEHSFKMDDIVTVTGTLQLNADDIEHFYYILNDVKGKLVDE